MARRAQEEIAASAAKTIYYNNYYATQWHINKIYYFVKILVLKANKFIIWGY